MRRVWVGALGLSLGWLAGQAAAEEYSWRPSAPVARAAGRATPHARLGQPVAVVEAGGTPTDPGIQLTGYQVPAVEPQPAVVRAKGEEVDAPRRLPELFGTGATAAAAGQGVVPAGYSSGSVLPSPEQIAPPRTDPASPVVPAPAAVPDGCHYFWPGNGPADCGCSSGAGSGGRAHACAAAPADDSGGGDRFYARGEYLLWWQRGARVPPLVTTSPPGSFGFIGQPGTSILLNGGLEEEPRSGGRFTAGYWLDDCRSLGIEGSFFFLGDRAIRPTFNSNQFPVLARPFFNLNTGTEFAEVVTAPGLATGSISTDFRSRLWGGDLNLRCNACCGCDYRLDLLGGVRYLDLHESLTITENIFAIPGGSPFGGDHIVVSDSFSTRNQFYGGQVGVVGELRRGRWFVDLTGKVALGDTHQTLDILGSQAITTPAGVTTMFRGGLLALPSNIGHFTRDRFGVAPEGIVSLGYQVTDHLRAFVGYDFLYWSNVVRPGDQIDRVIDVSQIPNFGGGLPTGQRRPAVLFRETDYWAQGVNFGLEFRY